MDALQRVNTNRRMLRSTVSDFLCAILLNDHLKTVEPVTLNNMHRRADHGGFMQWRVIAARDAAMQVYHFGTALADLRRYVGRSGIVYDHLNLRNGAIAFEKLFPNFHAMRSVIAHRGTEKLGLTYDDLEKHIHSRCGMGSFTIQGCEKTMLEGLHGDNYFLTGNMKIFEVALTREVSDKFSAIYFEICRAFTDNV